jgi:hypothetical protein
MMPLTGSVIAYFDLLDLRGKALSISLSSNPNACVLGRTKNRWFSIKRAYTNPRLLKFFPFAKSEKMRKIA